MPRAATAMWLSHNHSQIRLMSCGLGFRSLRTISRGSSSVGTSYSLPDRSSRPFLILRQICGRGSVRVRHDVSRLSQPVFRVDCWMSGARFERRNDRPQAYGTDAYAYGNEAYWDTRYTDKTGSFDWYQGYSGFSPIMAKYMSKTSRILMVGCGNALISEDMVKDGYQDIVNVDISAVVIEAMQKKYKDVPQLSYMRLDVRDMKTFKDATFDAVIDKGMLDALMCGDNGPYHSAIMLDEVCRVLRPGGAYMLITYGEPRLRFSYLRRLDWSIDLYVLPKPGSRNASSSRNVTNPVFVEDDGTLGRQFISGDPNLHYVYACTKDVPGEESSD